MIPLYSVFYQLLSGTFNKLNNNLLTYNDALYITRLVILDGHRSRMGDDQFHLPTNMPCLVHRLRFDEHRLQPSEFVLISRSKDAFLEYIQAPGIECFSWRASALTIFNECL